MCIVQYMSDEPYAVEYFVLFIRIPTMSALPSPYGVYVPMRCQLIVIVIHWATPTID